MRLAFHIGQYGVVLRTRQQERDLREQAVASTTAKVIFIYISFIYNQFFRDKYGIDV